LNRNRATAVMGRDGISALVATTPENFAYLTDYLDGLGPRQNRYTRFFAVVTRDDRYPVGMLCPRIHLLYGAERELPDLDIRSYGSYTFQGSPTEELTEAEQRLVQLRGRSPEEPDPFVVLARLLADRDIGPGSTVGVDEAMLSHNDWEELQKRMPGVKFVDGAECLREVRAVKTADEISRLRTALVSTNRAMQSTIPYIQPGALHRDIWGVLRRSMIEHGLDPRVVCVGIGPTSAFAATLPSCRPTEAGDFVKFDHSGIFMGYISDTGRTGVVGGATDKQRRYHGAALAGQQAGCDAVRPGVLARDVFVKMRDTVRENGFPDYDRPSLGHGIGVEVYDRPTISASDMTLLEPGMVVNVEVPLYELGFGGVQIEDTLLVTEDGHEYLAECDRSLFTIE
jgi:Xaa-Pro dipeptidase